MTGIEALQALREGKKVAHPDHDEEYYVQVIEYVLGGNTLKVIAWVRLDGQQITLNPVTWGIINYVDASLFLHDDWEIVG
jgi:hypothetical protein